MFGKLKPVNGWRSFLGEVGVIVLGVLIALGFGQLAQDWNDRRNLAAAEAAVRSEIASNLALLKNRQATQPCIDRRLSEISTFLDAGQTGKTLEAPKWIGRPQIWSMTRARWEAASQSGRISLLPAAKQGAYTEAYAGLAAVSENQKEEGLSWAQLRSLEGQLRLPDTHMATMRTVLSEARYFNYRVKGAIRQTNQTARELGITVPRPELRGSQSACVPMNTPRIEAIRLSRSVYGEP